MGLGLPVIKPEMSPNPEDVWVHQFTTAQMLHLQLWKKKVL